MKPRENLPSLSWEATFPKTMQTDSQSLCFVKKMVAIAISEIIYLRSVFPEYVFGDKAVEGIKLKILKEVNSCPGSIDVIEWVKGCYDALQKKYLRQMTLAFYKDKLNLDNVIETYTFRFTYNQQSEVTMFRNEKQFSKMTSVKQTKEATKKLMRTIVYLMQGLPTLPSKCFMTMKLLYYDDVTPSDYEPPGFVAAPNNTFLFDDETINIKLGEVGTPHHIVKMRLKTTKQQLIGNEETEDDQCFILLFYNINVQLHLDKMEEDIEETDMKVCCPCGCEMIDDFMLLCSVCRTKQHGVCFSVLDTENAPSKHVCNSCVDLNDKHKQPTDSLLIDLEQLDKKLVKEMCLFRKSLHFASKRTRIQINDIVKNFHISKMEARAIVDRLEKEHFLKSKKQCNGMRDIILGRKNLNETPSRKRDISKINFDEILDLSQSQEDPAVTKKMKASDAWGQVMI
ncbi:HORMA domain-containing protein 1 [Nymphon striatum]|nr:HORMA domain-containing protein 1 [Nymphon striatum]